METVIFLLLLIALFYWFIPGAVGGVIMALVLRSTDTRIDFAKVATIALGWAFAMLLGGITGRLVDLASLAYLKSMTYAQSVVSLIISLGITGMVTALIGSCATWRVLQSLGMVSEKAG